MCVQVLEHGSWRGMPHDEALRLLDAFNQPARVLSCAYLEAPHATESLVSNTLVHRAYNAVCSLKRGRALLSQNRATIHRCLQSLPQNAPLNFFLRALSILCLANEPS